MENPACGCTLTKEEELKCFERCPKCDRFLLDTFLIEPFPEDFDSPLRKLFKKIYSLDKVQGDFYNISGNQANRGILRAIDNAHICFCDLTGDNFNVAYEIGYAISNFDPGEKKLLVAGSSDRRGQHVLSAFFEIYNILPPDVDLSYKVDNYQISESLTHKKGRPSIIQNCDSMIRRRLSVEPDRIDPSIPEQIEEFYPDNSFPYPTKKTKKDVLVLTNNNFEEYFTLDDSSKINKIEIKNPFVFFRGFNEMKYLIEKICIDVIKEYDYLIIHLLDSDADGITEARFHNFRCGMISGMMKKFKKYLSVYAIKHVNSQFSSFDVPTFGQYSDNNEINSIFNELIEDRIADV